MSLRRLPLVALVACGGPENTIRDLYPAISVVPERLDFGQVGPPLSADAELVVTNVGRADLEVSGELSGDTDAIRLLDGPPDFRLEAGERKVLPVRFAPPSFRPYDARLRLQTNVTDRPVVTVDLFGEGVDLPFPDLQVEPSRSVEIDASVGRSELVAFDLVNQGDADLELGEVVLDGPSTFVVRVDPSGTRVVPGERTTMIVEYAPTDAGGEVATVHVPSNDPDEATLDVLLVGNGGGEELVRPIAHIAPCPSEVLLTGPETVHFSGTGSSDPGGHEPLTYQWVVSRRPDGSDASVPLDPATAPEVDLYVDLAGTWELALQVANTLQTVSAPTSCVFEAIPEDDLHVELSWDTPSADIDLHLLRGGADLFDTPDDCNYCNKNPNWGDAGDDDDPRLDIDDRGGFGPENINILHPDDDTYEVRVHYFEHNGDGPVQATVKVWLDGAESFVGSRVLDGDQVWSVGVARWPQATFTPNPAANDPGPGRVGCR